jgi:hypothetical protein
VRVLHHEVVEAILRQQAGRPENRLQNEAELQTLALDEKRQPVQMGPARGARGAGYGRFIRPYAAGI